MSQMLIYADVRNFLLKKKVSHNFNVQTNTNKN